MKTKYYCASCKNIFDATGTKKEWNDPIYGPCMKYTANCPDCGTEGNEYKELSQAKKSSAIPEMGCGHNCHSCEFEN